MKDFGKNERFWKKWKIIEKMKDFGNNPQLQGVLAGTKLACRCLPKTPHNITVCCFRKDVPLLCMGLWDQMGGALLRLRKDMCRKMMSHGCSWYNHYTHYEFKYFLKENFVFKKDKNNPRRSNVYLLMFCSVLSKFLKKVEGPTIGGRNLVAALCYLYYMNLSCAIFFWTTMHTNSLITATFGFLEKIVFVFV